MSFLGERNAIAIGVSQHAVLGSGPLLTRLSPSLLLQFAGAESLDPRITFTRSTTATRFNSSGLLEVMPINAARFDYNPVTLAPLGLLIEESRTNALLQSEAFDNSVAWDNRNLVSFSADTTTAPNGTTTADTMTADVETSVSVFAQTRLLYSISSGTTYTASLFVKAGTNSVIQLVFPSSQYGVNAFANFDLAAGTVGTVGSSSTASIVNAGNGWYRCVITATATTSSAANIAFAMAFTNNNSSATRLPTLTTAGTETVFLWGAQFEVGAFATSYIPTTTAAVTRAADVATMTGTNFSSWYNQSEGTFFAKATVGGVSAASTIIEINDGSTSSFIRLVFANTTARFQVANTATTQADLNLGTTTSQVKVVGAYKNNDFAGSLNAATPVQDASGSVPVVNQARIGSRVANDRFWNGYIGQIAYYNRRLSNAELQGITA